MAYLSPEQFLIEHGSKHPEGMRQQQQGACLEYLSNHEQYERARSEAHRLHDPAASLALERYWEARIVELARQMEAPGCAR